MSFPDKALWIIERNSAQSLTLDGIAAACGVSRSHLAHAFGTATGVSVTPLYMSPEQISGQRSITGRMCFRSASSCSRC